MPRRLLLEYLVVFGLCVVGGWLGWLYGNVATVGVCVGAAAVFGRWLWQDWRRYRGRG